MKDTMRKKPKEPAPDVTSPSSESVSTNPWSDAQSATNTDLSRQTSKASRELDSSPSKKISHSSGPSQTFQDNTDTASMTSMAPCLKPPDEGTNDEPLPGSLRTRRRKTVNKVTPHTFELADSELKPTPTKPKDPAATVEESNHTKPKDAPSTTEDPKPDTPNPPNSSLKRRQSRPPTTFTFSKVTTTINVKPTTPPPHSPRNAYNAPNPFASTHHRRAQSSLSTTATTTPPPPNIAPSNPVRFDPPSLTTGSPNDDFFAHKTIVLTHGASPIGWSITKYLHAFGARVIMGDVDAAKARKLIKSLDEPHLVHFQPCDCRRYGDMVDLFRLAVTMYGRVDHAVWGVGEDGGQGVSVGEGERGWFGREVEREPSGNLTESLGASVRFAHIALGFLRQGKNVGRDRRRWDRSLTLLTSVACFREMPGLPVYQVAQHGVLGLVRSLRGSVDPERDGVRVNAVVTGMMVARAWAGAQGRMSVKLPSDIPEDVGRTVVGVVAAGSAEGGSGIWYEGGDGAEKGEESGKVLHGRAIYVVGGECWDIEEGLRRSEQVWLGKEPSEVLNMQQEGVGTGSQWMLDLQ